MYCVALQYTVSSSRDWSCSEVPDIPFLVADDHRRRRPF